MQQTRRLFSIALCALLFSLPSTGAASEEATVRDFYDKLLNVKNPNLEQDAANLLADDWRSIGNYSGKNKDRETFVKGVRAYGQLIPNLSWNIQQVHQDGDTYIVRSRVMGTPNDVFFGVDPGGGSFDIMTIDIHTLTNGKISQSYHIEDWAGALHQLRAK